MHNPGSSRRFRRIVVVLLLACGFTELAQLPTLASVSLSLRWNASGKGATGYRVYYGDVSQTWVNQLRVSHTNVTVPNLVQGTTYFFAVSATNASGLESVRSEELVFTIPVLNVLTNGGGGITPDLGRQNLTVGARYTLKAVPFTGQIFAGWNGSLTSSSTNLSFTFTSNLVLRANFVPNPFAALQGTYRGLFQEDGDVRSQQRSGYFGITTTKAGAYSGWLEIGAINYKFTGQLDLQMHGTNFIRRQVTNALGLDFRIGTNAESDLILGRISERSWAATLFGYRAVFHAITNRAPYAGKYTMILPGQDGDPTTPTGDGYGTVLINTSGAANFVGAFADGSRKIWSTPVLKGGFWPMYISPYSGRGSIMGWLAYANNTSDDLSGRLNWCRLPGVASTLTGPYPYYKAGFAYDMFAVGSRYVPPATTAVRILNLTNASLAFSGGSLAVDFTNSITVGPSSKVTNLSANGLTLTFSLATGTFTGKVTDPWSGKILPFYGAVIQKHNAAYGFLLNSNQSSRVSLTPR